jgi:hypothetical protein
MENFVELSSLEKYMYWCRLISKKTVLQREIIAVGDSKTKLFKEESIGIEKKM